MISDMMLFAHPPEPTLQSEDLNSLVEQAAREVGGQVSEAGWSLRVEVASSNLVSRVDRCQILSALQAIVQNSIESQPNGEVSIGCRRLDDTHAVLEISDNGPGVSSETARHMFDPFYSGREAGRGLGFGLSKAWTIVQLHHGNIRALSTPGAGTTIVIELLLASGND
jgi:signal transduction histidine kinase